ncbi:MAG: ABC transporter permease [Leptolyngbyaceae cyanobacterium HOT.MB2.61]|nr:ABC transporter permease [Leptolyngbyaceae cyanobacterium HOT.MB2.61]
MNDHRPQRVNPSAIAHSPISPSGLPNQVTYTSASWFRQPGPPIWKKMWRDLLASRELAWRLMVKDLSAQYRQSMFGIAWAFIPPIILAAGFTFATNAKVINIGKTDIPYPAYVMLGTMLWQTFIEALNSPIQAITTSKGLLAKINFPREAIILAKLGQVFFNFGIKIILIAGVFLWFRIPVPWTIAIAPVALLHLIWLGTFIGLLLAPLAGLYNDVSKALPLIIGPWLFLTPVVFPVPSSGTFATVVKLNPVTPLLVTTRELATTGVISDPQGFWITSGIAIGGLLVAWILYRVAMPYVIERVSS